MLFLLVVIFAVFVFEYINGFHDAANAIATAWFDAVAQRLKF